MRKESKDMTITFRLESELYSKITASAKSAGVTVGEYIRCQLRKGKVIVKQQNVVDVPEIKQVRGELGKIGSNLNQIAHYYNGGGSRSREMYENIQRALADVYAMKFMVEKMGGDFFGGTKAFTGQKR